MTNRYTVTIFKQEENEAFNLFRVVRIYISRIPPEITRFGAVRIGRGTDGVQEGSLQDQGSSIGDINHRAGKICVDENGTMMKFLSRGFKRVQKESRDDWMNMVATGGLEVETKRLRHFEDGIIMRLLCFLFRADNVELLSWGTKRIVYNGEMQRFPAMIRKRSIEGLWRRYNEELGVGNCVRHIGSTVFRCIVS